MEERKPLLPYVNCYLNLSLARSLSALLTQICETDLTRKSQSLHQQKSLCLLYQATVKKSHRSLPDFVLIAFLP